MAKIPRRTVLAGIAGAACLYADNVADAQSLQTLSPPLAEKLIPERAGAKELLEKLVEHRIRLAGFDESRSNALKTSLEAYLKSDTGWESTIGGDSPEAFVEAIFSRPVLLVQNDSFLAEHAQFDDVRLQLTSHKAEIDNAIRSVGRIEVRDHDNYSWLGTGWVVADGIIATAGHVASKFAVKTPSGDFNFMTNRFGKKVKARIDFAEEYAGTGFFTVPELEFDIKKILHLEYDRTTRRDIALLQVDIRNTDDLPLPPPISLSPTVEEDKWAVAIGYPSLDGRAPESQLQAIRDAFGDAYGVKRIAPGKVRDVSGLHVFHDASTLGGNSGGPLINLETGEAMGLHINGYWTRRVNEAFSSSEIAKCLDTL